VEPLSRVDEKLRPGDRIVAINGDRRAGNIGPLLYLMKIAAGSEYDITVDRAGQTITYPLELTAFNDQESFYLSLGELVEGYGFFLTGLLMCCSSRGSGLRVLRSSTRRFVRCTSSPLLAKANAGFYRQPSSDLRSCYTLSLLSTGSLVISFIPPFRFS